MWLWVKRKGKTMRFTANKSQKTGRVNFRTENELGVSDIATCIIIDSIDGWEARGFTKKDAVKEVADMSRTKMQATIKEIYMGYGSRFIRSYDFSDAGIIGTLFPDGDPEEAFDDLRDAVTKAVFKKIATFK